MSQHHSKTTAFAFTVVAAFLATASVAFACVTFKGTMAVDGHDEDTIVTGTGNQHAYCSNGYPKTAAAGHLADSITISVSPGTCNDAGALLNHKLDPATYEVRYNNRPSYAGFDTTASVDGRWTMVPLSGCFFGPNASTTTTLGTFTVGTSGSATWTGTLTPPDLKPANVPSYALPEPLPGTASNLCIGAVAGTYTPDPVNNGGGPPGMLAPYRLLAI